MFRLVLKALIQNANLRILGAELRVLRVLETIFRKKNK